MPCSKQKRVSPTGETLFEIKLISYFAATLRRSAQRSFIASAIALRPSGLSLRFVAFAGAFGSAAFTTTGFEFLLPLGRPRRPLFTGAAATAAAAATGALPPNIALACCNSKISAPSLKISVSICAITSLIANTLPPMFRSHSTGEENSTLIVRALTNTSDDTEINVSYQIIARIFCNRMEISLPFSSSFSY